MSSGPRFKPSRLDGLPIAFRLAFVLVLVVVPLAVLVLVQLFTQYKQDVLAARTSAALAARVLALSAEARLLQIQGSLQGLASTAELQSGDLRGFDERARKLHDSFGVVNLVLLDENGRQVVNTLLPWGEPLPNPGRAAPALAVFGSGAPMARIARGAVTGAPIAVVSVPVRIGSEVRFALSGVVQVDELDRILQAGRLPPPWIAALLDDRGTIAARTVEAERFVGKPASERLRAAMAAAGEGSFDGRTLEGIDVVTAFSRSPGVQWTVAIGIPRDELTRELRRSLAVWAIATLTLLVAVLAMAWQQNRRITRDIRTLVDMSVALGRGQRIRQSSLAIREIQQVGHALVTASQELRDSHERLAEREARLQAVLDSAPDGILVADGANEIVAANLAAGRLFGDDATGLMRRPVADLLDLSEFAADSPVSLQRAEGRRSDNSVFPAEFSRSQVEDAGERLQVYVVRDVTERDAMVAALRRSNNELEQFAFVASHDMRSPLRSIKGLLGVLQQTYGAGLGDRGRDLLERCLRAADRLDRLTDDLLTFARGDANGGQWTQVDMGDVSREVAGLLSADLEQAGARLQIGELPVMPGHREQLVRLLLNLVGNSIKYRAERPLAIAISGGRDAAGWHLSVQDNGIGIEPEYAEQIFTLFKRLHTQASIPGSGIGLATCRKIVLAHGGRIWVDSRPGEGSQFQMTFHEGGIHASNSSQSARPSGDHPDG